MSISANKSVENISFALRKLYRSYGYLRYKMNKFEEYDFYVRNKDFLVSDSVITFTDTNGKLMALKPDVTLSIVKNTRDVPGCVQKVYYNEHVYRVSGGERSFREIVQLGLECIGDIDDYCIYEVLSLAAQSLSAVSSESVLNISHLGIFADILDGVDSVTRREIMRCVRDKNIHELRRVCDAASLQAQAAKISFLLECYGTPKDVLPKVEALLGENAAVAQLKRLTDAFAGSEYENMLRIDFSVVNDINYYNGVLFKGFVEGVPQGVLSGGQYDKLMRKMGRKAGAIGFAVYTDLLEGITASGDAYDVDLILIYDAESDIKAVYSALNVLKAENKRAIAQKSIPENLRYRQLARFINGEVVIQ